MNVDQDAIPPQNAAQELIQQWIPLAIKIAREQYVGDSRFDADEREGVALLALVQAEKNYDITKINPQTGKSYSFGSYAGRVIWSKLGREARKRGSIISRPSPGSEVEEMKQQTMSEYAEAAAFYTESFDAVEMEDFVAKLKNELSREEFVVAKGLLADERYEKIMSRLRRFKQYRGRTNLAIVAKLRKSVIKKMEANGWAEYLGQLEKQPEPAKEKPAKPAKPRRRKRRGPKVQQMLF